MYQSEFCEVSYNEELNIVFVTWKKFCRDKDYRGPMCYALAIMKDHKGCNYCADTRNGFENEEADTQWVFDVFLPQAAAASCQKIFFIVDADNSLKKELEGQAAQLGKQFEVHYCLGLEDVKQILKEQAADA